MAICFSKSAVSWKNIEPMWSLTESPSLQVRSAEEDKNLGARDWSSASPLPVMTKIVMKTFPPD